MDEASLYMDKVGRGDADESLESIVRAVRVGGCATRGEVSAAVGLGKAAVSERVRRLIDSGVLEESGQIPSGGGRPSAQLRFASEAGFVAGVEVGISQVSLAIHDLGGSAICQRSLECSMSLGPDLVLSEVGDALADLVAKSVADGHGPWLGIGVGVAAPVEFATGKTIMPPLHPNWHDQPVRDRLQQRFGVPVWVDNEVNAIALAEMRLGAAVGVPNALVMKVGSFVGAGLISNGQLHRGAQGCAGSLASAAGGEAIARNGAQLARSGASPFLAERLADRGTLSALDVAQAAGSGDESCMNVLADAATDIGRTLALLVDFFNPSLVVITGRVAEVGDRFLSTIRETVYRCSIALASRDLQLVRSLLGSESSTLGPALLAVDQLVGPQLADTIRELEAHQSRKPQP